MAGTYFQIYMQVVFVVKGRQNLFCKDWRDEVFKYMCGIIKNKVHKPIIVNIAYVYNYVLNQEKHHSQQAFQDEYLDFLRKFKIEHDVKYLFEWIQ